MASPGLAVSRPASTRRAKLATWTIRLRRPLPFQALLLMTFLGAFGFLRYYPALQLRTLSELCLVLLFSWLAVSTRIDSRWVKYVILPTLSLGLFVLLYAYIFTLRTGEPTLPSVLAQRHYIYFLLGPALYLLYLRGWKVSDFQQVFLVAAALTIAGFVAYDISSSSSILLSGQFFDPRLEATYGGDKAGDLRNLKTAALLLGLYFGGRLLQSGDALLLPFRLGGMTACAALVVYGLPRGLLASIIAAILLYGLFLSRPAFSKVMIVMLPLALAIPAILAPEIREYFVASYINDPSYEVRIDSAEIARNSFQEYPFFGFGQESYATTTFRDLFGEHFYPADIGIMGVIFQFGLVGLTLYALVTAWLCVSLIRTMWFYAGRLSPPQKAFLWALLMTCLSFMFTSPLQARFIFGEGLFIGAFAWGLVMIYWHSFSGQSRKRGV